MFVLGGCGHRELLADAAGAAPARPPIPAVASRGTPVSPQAAQVLERAPAGARLAYGLPNGVPADLVLGPPYQSGLQAACRMGRSAIGGGGGERRSAYVFCRQGDQWYAMQPVVVSGL